MSIRRVYLRLENRVVDLIDRARARYGLRGFLIGMGVLILVATLIYSICYPRHALNAFFNIGIDIYLYVRQFLHLK